MSHEIAPTERCLLVDSFRWLSSPLESTRPPWIVDPGDFAVTSAASTATSTVFSETFLAGPSGTER